MVKKIVCILSILFCLTSGISAERPKVGLVLAGGGAKGFAHIGVLKVLEDNGIHVDYIAGTSMGGIVGALSAYGYSAREIEKVVKEIDWASLFIDGRERDYMSYSNKTADAKYFMTVGFDRKGMKNAPGVISGQKIQNKFYELVGPCSNSDNFDDLPTPFRCVATDILTGKEVVLKDGSLADAMRSTMSIPGIFTPVEKGEYLLVDGGVVNNLPVDVMKDMGADIIIAVNLSQNEVSRDTLRGPVLIANQMLNLFIYDQQQEQLKMADIVISPDLGGKYDSTSYFSFTEIEQCGEKAARAMLPAVKAAVGPENISNIPKIGVMRKEPVVIDRIEVPEELESYERSIFMKKLGVFSGKPLDIDELNHIVQDFHSSGQYESIRYYVDQVDGENVLAMEVEPSKKGPHFFRLGLFYDMNTNVHENYIFNVLLGLEFNDLLIEGDTFENEVDLFTGIAARSSYFIPFLDYYFIRPEVKFYYLPDQEENFGIGFDGDVDAERTEMRVASSLSIGTFNRMFGEISAGFMNEYIYYDYEVTNFFDDDFRGIVNSVFLKSRMDNINSVVLPERGNFLELMLKYSDRHMGSEDTYLKGKISFWQYFQFLERISLGGKVFAGMDFGTDLPFYDMEWFTYVNAFPGYTNYELQAPNIVAGVLDFKLKLCDLGIGSTKSRVLLTFRGGYASLYEDFNLFQGKKTYDIYGFGIGLGLSNSKIPIWLEGAWNDDRRFTLHISAGNKF
ncbi:MAG: patatin-like phospholipase family protein [Spirochaetia bacterium]|nr:patatin-like phospholipase family protein [Spirochaetia bacterium]